MLPRTLVVTESYYPTDMCYMVTGQRFPLSHSVYISLVYLISLPHQYISLAYLINNSVSIVFFCIHWEMIIGHGCLEKEQGVLKRGLNGLEKGIRPENRREVNQRIREVLENLGRGWNTLRKAQAGRVDPQTGRISKLGTWLRQTGTGTAQAQSWRNQVGLQKRFLGRVRQGRDLRDSKHAGSASNTVRRGG